MKKDSSLSSGAVLCRLWSSPPYPREQSSVGYRTVLRRVQRRAFYALRNAFMLKMECAEAKVLHYHIFDNITISIFNSTLPR